MLTRYTIGPGGATRPHPQGFWVREVDATAVIDYLQQRLAAAHPLDVDEREELQRLRAEVSHLRAMRS